MFAIVRFIEEDDAPGIVATNWLNKDKSTCLVPNVRSEGKRNKLLIARETPGKNWFACPVILLKEFSSYSAARNLLSQAEALSNLESSTESKSRKRKKKIINTSVKESSSSEEDEIPKISPKKSPKNAAPPYVQSLEILGQSDQITSSKKKRINQDSLNLDSQDPETSSSSDHSSPQIFYAKAFQRSISTPQVTKEELPLSVNSLITKCRRDIDLMLQNQQDMWGVFNEFLHAIKNIEAKLDAVLLQLEDKIPSCPDEQYIADLKFISTFPLEMDGFIKLNDKLAESPSFRQRLTQLLMAVGGRDCKALVPNILRRLILDEVGEKFSLTGKFSSKTGQVKQSFEKTEVYELIIEICQRIFSDTKLNLNTVRESIGDWLMQAKFRRNRREQRMKKMKKEDLVGVMRWHDEP